MKTIAPQRIVALVGRPNVGKSALFNRIAGRRVAIVHEEAGVTRDRICCEATWRDQRFELIDTGGLGVLDQAAARDAIAEGIRRQVEAAIEDAAVILFVVDVTAGVTPLDQDVARRLHRAGRRVCLLANKADNEALDGRASEFERLGFPVFSVSALHDRGFDSLMPEIVKILPDAMPEDKPEALRVAIVGKPNAGKSSYINRILRDERLIVSETPGTTRDSIEIPFVIGRGPQARHYVLVDTAGLRRIRREDNAVERYSVMRAEKSIARADVVVLVMDAEQGPTLQDKKIAALILEHRKGCVLLINKWDLAGKLTQRSYEKALRATMPFLSFAPVVFASAKSGFNIRGTIETIDHVAAQVSSTLATGMLNRVLHDAVERVQPPMMKGARLRFYYATQVGTRPIRLRLFVNDPRRMNDAYRQYLIRTLRAAYGLEGAPVILDLKSSHKGGFSHSG